MTDPDPVFEALADPTRREMMRALAEDFKPLTDMRASAAYRLQVAGNLLRRFWLETRAEAPLGEADVNVWARGPSSSVPLPRGEGRMAPSPSGRGLGAERGFRAASGEPAQQSGPASPDAHCK